MSTIKFGGVGAAPGRMYPSIEAEIDGQKLLFICNHSLPEDKIQAFAERFYMILTTPELHSQLQRDPKGEL